MKIAITQRETLINGIAHDCLDNHWYTILEKHEVIPVPNLGATIALDFDMLIISGGETTINRTATELLYYQIALLKGIPILGICHGAFFINEQSGGANTTIIGHKNTEHLIWMDGKSHTVNSYHTLDIKKLGSNFVSIASLANTFSIEAFRHRELPIWGIVWHPERMAHPVFPKNLKRLIYG